MNYIYGTWQVLRGLRALNLDMNEPWLLKARDWLESVQHEDGGWGERCNTYDDPVFKGQGPSTASQTAWAVMGLCAFGDPDRPSLQRGIEYLIRTQNADGSWTEDETTGTGFPKVFYLKYDMYRNAWPLLALATYRQLLARETAGQNGEVNGKSHLTNRFAIGCRPRQPVGVRVADFPRVGLAVPLRSSTRWPSPRWVPCNPPG